MKRIFLGIFIALALLGLGAWLSWRWQDADEPAKEVEATVLLERVREVCQLVTVEAQLSEVYNETNLREVTLYLPIPTQWQFSKRAMLEVQAKVLVGYDMEQLSITIDSAAKLITLSNLPEPTILAIDHELKYRDLDESFFNSFTPEDYTQLNANAKAVIREKAVAAGLLEDARQRGNAMLNAIEFMAANMGWRVAYRQADGTLRLPEPFKE
ncbi:MAG: DUF4230 domain-containing protein [Bacteroidetes bacterium]|nr:MAG: DUF4230 domain-containing protein [Bacteroidota bacterium]